MIYSYEAKDQSGRTVTGSLDADDERMAATLVREQGYFPMRLLAQGGPSGAGTAPAGYAPRAATQQAQGNWLLVHLIYPLWTGVSLGELALFYRQFGAMLRAGVPIYQCLTSLIAQTRNTSFRSRLQSISDTVQRGGLLSEAMGQFPWIFTDFQRAMVVAGETSGRLDLMFARLAEALEMELAMRRTIRRETFYPKMVLTAVLLVPPLPLLVLGGLRPYLLHVVPTLVCVGAAVLGLSALNRYGAQARGPYHAFLAHLPHIGGTVRMIALARFARTLASLFAAGVLVPKALQSAAEACGNAFLGGRIVRAIPRIMAGAGVTEALSATGVFPPMVVSMLGTGEQTGSLDMTMDKVAEFYEQEAMLRLHQTCVVIGVIALLIAAAAVFVTVLRFYTGYFGNLLAPD